MTQITLNIRVLAVAAVLLAIAILIVVRFGDGEPAEATHGSTPGQIDLVAIDTDTTGNGAKTISSIEDCVAANPGDTLDVDVIVDEVDPADGLAGVDFTFAYDPTYVTIDSIQDSTGVLMSDDGSAVLSFTSNPGSDDPVGDADSDPEGVDGTIKIAAADFGDTSGNFGSGLIARVTLTLSGTSGLANLSLATLEFVDANNNGLPVIEAGSAQIASGVPCPGSVPKTDIAVSDVVVAAPATAAAGATFQVTADANIENMGPDGPASIDATATLSVPSDCTTTSTNPVTTSAIALNAAESGRFPSPAASWDVSCSSPSDHSFAVTTSTAVDSSSVDNVQANNSASGQTSSAITADADLKITAFAITAPADTLAGQPFTVTGQASIHNNGPLSPAEVNVNLDLSLSPGCVFSNIVTPIGHVTAPASETVVIDGSVIKWRVRCDQPGTHAFSASAVASAGQLHVTDPNTGNNSWDAGTSTTTKIGACQEDPNPTTNPFQNLGPTLLTLLTQLTSDGSEVPEDQQVALDCYYNLFLDDNGGGPVDDCESALIEEIPCDIKIDVGIDLMGGTPSGTPGTVLNPIAVNFLPSAFTLADDTAVPNGATAGQAEFYIRSDAGLGSNGGECLTDVAFEPRVGVEGGIRGNVPDSNDDAALGDPNVWPNDLNAEVALVESSFDVNPLTTELTLWSRTIIPLSIEGVLDLPLNVMVWSIDDPTLQTITQSRWVMVAFPGDAVGPDPAGAIGGDPDSDDPTGGSVLMYCTPFSESITLYGEVGGVVRNKCTSTGDQVGWALMDPNAVDFTGDDGTRSNTSPCSSDVDGDGLTATEEDYYGTDALNADSDGDGFQDGSDNCPADANPDQENFDGDAQGDTCDPDIDGDGTANASDLCPQTPTSQHADSNGCSQAQVDSDADGACDEDAPSAGPNPGCTGTDNCPNIANADQSDVDGDGYGDACDGCPTTANAWPVPSNDDDCDGFKTSVELSLGTDPNVACGFSQSGELSANWPADLVASNTITISDVLALKPVFNTSVPPAAPRYDLVPSGDITISDVLALKPVFNKSCSP